MAWVATHSGPTKVPRPKLATEDLSWLYARGNLRPAFLAVRVAVGIVLSLACYTMFPSPFTFVIGFLLISGLQHHLLIIHHEAMHYLLFTNRRWNDFAGALVAYPIGFTMAYRRQHFDHHYFLGTDRDPDLPSYRHYPSRPRVLVLDGLKDLLGITAIAQFLRQTFLRASKNTENVSYSPKKPALMAMMASQLGIFSLFWALGYWTIYFLLWLLPLLTLTKTLTHLRNVAEHTLLRDVGDPELSRYRTILCGIFERFFFAPMNFNYHAEHHFYPSIPYYHLPEAHRLLSQQDGYANVVEIERGYLRFIFRKASGQKLSPSQGQKPAQEK